jgi:hypothetical protein
VDKLQKRGRSGTFMITISQRAGLIEPGTSRTRSKNYTPKPISLDEDREFLRNTYFCEVSNFLLLCLEPFLLNEEVEEPMKVLYIYLLICSASNTAYCVAFSVLMT